MIEHNILQFNGTVTKRKVVEALLGMRIGDYYHRYLPGTKQFTF